MKTTISRDPNDVHAVLWFGRLADRGHVVRYPEAFDGWCYEHKPLDGWPFPDPLLADTLDCDDPEASPVHLRTLFAREWRGHAGENDPPEVRIHSAHSGKPLCESDSTPIGHGVGWTVLA